jgi:recombination protein RecR
LFDRVGKGGVKEIVLALGATLEGDTTAFYINRRLEGQGVQVSMIARGISIGGELEQVDEVTLGRSIADRKPYEQSVKR